MTLQEMIDSLQDQAQDKDNLAIGDPFGPDDPENIFAQDAKALREAARLLGEMKLPNDPLTLEELREMDGEPVWIYIQKYRLIKCRVISNIDESLVRFTDGAHDWIKDYGKTWIAYHQKPGEGIT